MNKDRLKKRLASNEDPYIDGPEEYYYLIGQMIVYVFEKLGGADNFRREFCYLTCPNIPCDAKKLNKRAIHFLLNAPSLLKHISQRVQMVYENLLEWNLLNSNISINLKMCEEAFYDGIYEENLLLKL